MKYLPVIVFTLISSQVESGIILGKIGETLGHIERHIKCKSHTLGNKIFQHGHNHDPCAAPDGQDDSHHGQNWHDFGHGGQFHEHNDHQLGHYDQNQGQNWLNNGRDGHFHELGNDGRNNPTTEKECSNHEKVLIHQYTTEDSNPKTNGKNVEIDESKHDVSKSTTSTTRHVPDDGDNGGDETTRKVITSTTTIPNLDIRMDRNEEVPSSSPKNQIQDGRRVLGQVKINCPDGTIADAKGICREVYM